MLPFWQEPWFLGAVVVAIAVPILVVVLTEVIGTLTRRNNPAVKPLRLLRNLVIPATALLALMLIAQGKSDDLTGVRIVATIVGFLLILLVLSSFNAALFGTPAEGTWRARIPSIFVSIVRLLLGIVGIAVLFAVVWGTNIGGVFAALGVTSIVLGIALQGSIGAIVSGLLLLFEQPFRTGDVIDTSRTRGRVVEVNWRSVHVQTPEGIEIIPNSVLATAVFNNHSRTTEGFVAVVDFTFGKDDQPRRVMDLLEALGRDLPGRRPGGGPTAEYTGGGVYTVTVPVVAAAAVGPSTATLHEWVWYAARRAGLTLDGQVPKVDQEVVDAGVARACDALFLSEDHRDVLAPGAVIEVFAPGEIIQHSGVVADSIRVVLAGRIRFEAPVGEFFRPVLTLAEGEFLGQTALTRETALGRYVAVDEVTVVRLPSDHLDPLLTRVPAFARTIGKAIDLRRRAIRTTTEQPA